MKKRHVMTLAACSGLLAALGLLFVGCELFQPTEVDGYFEQNPYQSNEREKENPGDLTIDPTAATVNWIGEEVIFTIEGGNEPIKWRVSESDHGSVMRSDNDRQAVYKAKTVAPNVVIAEDANGRTVASPVNGTIPALEVIPGNSTIPAGSGAVINYTALGGVPPYEWKVSFPGMATLTVTGSDDQNAAYTETGGITGTNILYVIDQASSSKQVQIIHE